MMNSGFKHITSATAVLLVLAISQLCLPVSLAESASLPQQATAILTTANNKPITVNDASAITGATITPGAMIETPDQVSASMIMPGHFTLDIAPKAKLSVAFDAGSIKVNLIRGCVVLHTTKGTTGEIDTSRGVAGKTDGSKDDRIDVCDPPASPAPGSGGLGTPGIIALIGAAIGALALIPILTGGDNPSPGAPQS